MKYAHLNATERELIAKKLRVGESIRAIEKALERSPSSISREIRRNSLADRYTPQTARLAAEKRAQNSRNAKTISAEILAYIFEKLKKKYSPEQICGVLKKQLNVTLSFSTIYRHIHADKRNGGKAYKDLRGAKKRRKKYGVALNGRGKIPHRSQRIGLAVQPGVHLLPTQTQLAHHTSPTTPTKYTSKKITKHP